MPCGGRDAPVPRPPPHDGSYHARGAPCGPRTSGSMTDSPTNAPYGPPEGPLNGRTVTDAPSARVGSTGAQNGSCHVAETEAAEEQGRREGRRQAPRTLLRRRRQTGVRVVENGRRRVRVRGLTLVHGVPPACPTGAEGVFFRNIETPRPPGMGLRPLPSAVFIEERRGRPPSWPSTAHRADSPGERSDARGGSGDATAPIDRRALYRYRTVTGPLPRFHLARA
jgi:hypothetical protein